MLGPGTGHQPLGRVRLRSTAGHRVSTSTIASPPEPCQDACSVSETAGAVFLQLGRNSVALSHCRRAQGPRSSHKALLNLPDSASLLTSHIQASPSPPRLSVFSLAATAISGQDTSLYTTLPHTHCWAFDFTGLHSQPLTLLPFTSKRTGALCTCWVLCLECPSAHPLPKVESSGKKTQLNVTSLEASPNSPQGQPGSRLSDKQDLHHQMGCLGPISFLMLQLLKGWTMPKKLFCIRHSGEHQAGDAKGASPRGPLGSYASCLA